MKVLEFFGSLYSVFTFSYVLLLFLSHYGCACYSRSAGGLKLEPIETSLNFKDDEHCKLLERVVNIERTVKALEAQLNTTISKVKTNEVLLDEKEQYVH